MATPVSSWCVFTLVIFREPIWVPASCVALVVKNPAANAGDVRDMGLTLLVKLPGERNGNPRQYSYLETYGQRSLACYSLWDHRESDMTEFL